MERIAIALVAAFLAGCASSTPIADALIIGVVGVSAVDYARDPNPPPFPSPSSIFMFGNPAPAAPLAPGRLINEQDCSQPIDWSRGNIRCK